MNNCIFTVDVEEYYHAENIQNSLSKEEISKLPSRIEIGTRKLLDLLSRYNSKATFFVLGRVAEKNRNLIKEIADQGHEIASHGYYHEPLYKHTPGSFEKDLSDSINILSDITSQKIIGYRATSFSFLPGVEWFFDILKKHEIIYDSSLCLSLFRHCHHKGLAKSGFNEKTKGILEFSPSFIRLGLIQLPLGGGYFRAYPYWLTKWGLDMASHHAKTPPLFYIHPWELDSEQPRLRLPPVKYIRHYLNLSKTKKTLKQLLSDMKFTPIRDIL